MGPVWKEEAGRFELSSDGPLKSSLSSRLEAVCGKGSSLGGGSPVLWVGVFHSPTDDLPDDSGREPCEWIRSSEET